jgi:hypothetical protein
MAGRIMSPQQRAIRLLYTLTAGAERFTAPGPAGEAAVFRGVTRLNAMAFWVRYPDYLANELLSIFEQQNDREALTAAGRILDDEEPLLRSDAMIRFRHGAYEKMDSDLSFLASRRILRRAKWVAGDQTLDVQYLLMPLAFELAERAAREFPSLCWYSDRMELVLKVVRHLGDMALKRQQYLQPEYATTAQGTPIPSIEHRVRERYLALAGRA